MRPILFDKNATNFTTNGIGRLTPISCSVTEERNGIFELEMVVKLGCDHFSYIKHSYIIVAKPSPSRNPQPFRIYSVSRPINGKVKVKAQHLSYWLNYIPVMPFSAQSAASALNGFKTNAAESCPFSFWTDISSNSSYAVAAPESIRHYLGGVRGSILDVYGGEYEWDGFTVKLHRARGQDRGVIFRYGKNITDLRQEENIANTFTGICPYWLSTEGQMVTLPEKVVRSSNASNFPFQRTVVKDFSDKFDNAPTVEQLRAYSQSYVSMTGIGVPSVSIEVNPVDISQTEEYKDSGMIQTLELCDTVKVEFSTLGVSTIAKITKTVYDVLSERYVKLGIGDVRSSLARTIEEQMDTISYMPTTTEMHRNIDRATGVLNGGLRGYVIINRNSSGYANEILILDNDTIANAKNVIRINNAGIGFSTNGYGGPYTNAWTIDGELDADFIKTGTLSASRVHTGVMESNDGKMGVDLDNTKISMTQGTTENGVIYNSTCEISDASLKITYETTDTTDNNSKTTTATTVKDDYIEIDQTYSDGTTEKMKIFPGTIRAYNGSLVLRGESGITLKGSKLTVNDGSNSKRGYTGTIGSAQYMNGICIGKA